MYEDVTFSFETDIINGAFGDATTPGIIYIDGEASGFHFVIDEALTFNGLTITPTTEFLLGYLNSETQFQMSGDFTFNLEGQSISANFEIDPSPGFIYKDNALQPITMTITDSFELKGRSITPDDLVFEYSHILRGCYMTGDFTFPLGDSSISGSMNDFNAPRLTYIKALDWLVKKIDILQKQLCLMELR